MAFPNKYAQVNCVWCGDPIVDWGNSRTNVKKHNVHTNGKCYAYLVYYEKNLRQLQAYMKTMPEPELKLVQSWFEKFGRVHCIKLGDCEIRLVQVRKITQVENLITNPIPV